MNDPETTLNALASIADESESWSRPEQLAAYATITILIRELDEYTQSHKVHDKGYALEKLGSIHSDILAAFRLDDGRGFTVDRHFHWMRAAIDKIRFGILGTGETPRPND